jgi:hypothetical protein
MKVKDINLWDLLHVLKIPKPADLYSYLILMWKGIKFQQRKKFCQTWQKPPDVTEHNGEFIIIGKRIF